MSEKTFTQDGKTMEGFFALVLDFLSENFGISYEREKVWNDLFVIRNERKILLPVDFFVSNRNVVIEVDSNYHDPIDLFTQEQYLRRLENDTIRNNYCIARGIHMHRIRCLDNVHTFLEWYFPEYFDVQPCEKLEPTLEKIFGQENIPESLRIFFEKYCVIGKGKQCGKNALVRAVRDLASVTDEELETLIKTLERFDSCVPYISISRPSKCRKIITEETITEEGNRKTTHRITTEFIEEVIQDLSRLL
jgi:hypothetical protein